MPDSIRLVAPTAAVHASYLQASAELRATHGRGSHWPGYDVLPGRSFTDDEVATAAGFGRFVDTLRSSTDAASTLPSGYVRNSRLWLVDFGTPQPTFLGRISIRHELNEFLRNVGGHIGYVIRPSARRRGLATRMLGAALPLAAQLGIDPALVTCDLDNVASAKVIVANGGAEDMPSGTKRRFWLPTRPATGPPVVEVLERQWSALRAWLERLAPADLSRPSVLPGWAVSDLVAHLTRSCSTLTSLRPAPAGATPITLHRYVSAYAEAAAAIAAGSRALAVEIGADSVGAFDAAWGRARVALARLGPAGAQVVQAPRGPMRLADFVLSRVLELVVHADDLARSLGQEPPLLPAAVAAVAKALDDIAVARSDEVLRTVGMPDLTWIRLACGRLASGRTDGAGGLPLL